MKVGDWVFFKTRNWPKDVRLTEVESDTGEATDITGKELYAGRGQIVGIAGGNYTVREEKSNRLVEIGPHPDDEIRSLEFDYSTLTLGHLREFLERHKDAPDDIPIMIALPLSFFSDLDEMPPDHPEYKEVSEFQSVVACGIDITGFSQDGDLTDEYIPQDGRGGEEWDFSVEITPSPKQCFEALREREDDGPERLRPWART